MAMGHEIAHARRRVITDWRAFTRGGPWDEGYSADTFGGVDEHASRTVAQSPGDPRTAQCGSPASKVRLAVPTSDHARRSHARTHTRRGVASGGATPRMLAAVRRGAFPSPWPASRRPRRSSLPCAAHAASFAPPALQRWRPSGLGAATFSRRRSRRCAFQRDGLHGAGPRPTSRPLRAIVRR